MEAENSQNKHDGQDGGNPDPRVACESHAGFLVVTAETTRASVGRRFGRARPLPGCASRRPSGTTPSRYLESSVVAGCVQRPGKASPGTLETVIKALQFR